jgi:peptidoglycan/LPS O-acetylase OafA/YrhL
MEASGVTQYAGAAMFGFLAVASVALFSFLSVMSWLGMRTAERQARDRFSMMKALLEHPGEQGERVLAAWREQELRKEEQDRRGRVVGGAVVVAVGASLSVMMAVLSDRDSGAWVVGLIPLSIGIVITLFAIVEKRKIAD